MNLFSSNKTLGSVNSGIYYLLLFIFWPFLAFIFALFNYSQKEAKRVVFFFLIYYGLTFVNTNESVDAFRYVLELKANAKLPFSDLLNLVRGLYTDASVDIIEPVITFMVSRFTSHHSLLFACYAAIFGFFYLKSINLLYDRYRVNPGVNAQIFMIFFIILIPITLVGSIRMPIAAWMFFFGAYRVIIYRDTKYLILTLASSLMHWSFITANIILLIYYFAGNRNLIYLSFLGLSFVLPSLMAPVLRSAALRIGGPLQSRYEIYSNEGYISGVYAAQEQASWFLRLRDGIVFYFFVLAIAAIQLTRGNMMKEKEDRNMFSFLILFLAFVNFGRVVPTFGNRFQLVFYLFAALYIFMFMVKLTGKKMDYISVIGLLPLLLFSAIRFRTGSESLDVLLFAPGLGIPFLGPGLSIADFLFH